MERLTLGLLGRGLKTTKMNSRLYPLVRNGTSNEVPLIVSLAQKLDGVHSADHNCKLFRNVGCISFFYNV